MTWLGGWLITMRASRRTGISAFIRWTDARHLTDDLGVPVRRHGMPEHFLHDVEFQEQLRRCLNDPALPL
ncbi:hypothetical protein [Streptomyces sp. NPDC048277]|uniref:hypothetical protein n=1 Tax=Streptomyces sp. NPDC048277 TaxID=3155027 RepID=UPI0033D4CD78